MIGSQGGVCSWASFVGASASTSRTIPPDRSRSSAGAAPIELVNRSFDTSAGPPTSRHDHHRRGAAVGATVGDRSAEQAGDSAGRSCSQDQQIGVFGNAAQHEGWLAFQDVTPDLNGARFVGRGTDCLIERRPGSSLVFLEITRIWVPEVIGGRVAPDEDGIERGSSQLTLADRPAQRLARLFGAINADDDTNAKASAQGYSLPDWLTVSVPRLFVCLLVRRDLRAGWHRRAAVWSYTTMR